MNKLTIDFVAECLACGVVVCSFSFLILAFAAIYVAVERQSDLSIRQMAKQIVDGARRKP